jgi:hypothetical protein
MDEEEGDEESPGPIVSPRINCDGNDTFDTAWRKVLGKIEMSRTYQPIGINAEPEDEEFTALELLGPDYHPGRENYLKIDPDAVRRVLTKLGRKCMPILIIDEFDQLAPGPRKGFADLIKMLSDHAVPATVVLVGVAASIDGLLKDHESVGRALVQIKMPRMTAKEIRKILTDGMAKLGMTIDGGALRKVSAISQGLPYYAHLLGKHSSREALKRERLNITVEDVDAGIARATEDAQQSVQKAYHEAVRSPQKGNLYADVLLACAMAKCDELGYFKAQDVRGPMCAVTGKDYDIPNFARHLSDFAGERGPILHKVGEAWRVTYHFIDPLMQPFVLMQGEVAKRLPAGFYWEED